MNPSFLHDLTGRNDGKIDALQGIEGTHDFHVPPCKIPFTINECTFALNVDNFNNEDETNFEL